MSMTMVEVLSWMDRGYPLRRWYDDKGNYYWTIAGEKCSGIVAAMIKRDLLIVGRDYVTMTPAGLDLLRTARAKELVKERG